MIFLVGGISPDHFGSVQGRWEQAVGPGNLVVSAPLRLSGFSDRRAALDAHVKDLVDKAAAVLEKDRRKADGGLASIFLQENPEDLERIADAMFPFAVTSPAQVVRRAHGSAVKGMPNLILDAVRSAVPKARAAVRVMQVELQQRSNTCPFMLPLRNFRSKTLSPDLTELANVLRTTDQPEFVVAEARRKMLERHPMERAGGEHRYFADDADVRFKMPGRHLHGVANAGQGHSSRCFISGMFRLGGRLIDGFHYDCSKESGRLSGTRGNCHDEARDHSGRYLNISPNDYIRAGQ